MRWDLPWISSYGSAFNFDYQASFTPEQQREGGIYNFVLTKPLDEEREGLSVFVRDGDAVFHTYSTYARGIDTLNAAYELIDLTPIGRDEAEGAPQYWVRRHDEYE